MGCFSTGNSVRGERIMEEAVYPGIRIRLRGTLEAAIASLQIDIGFGDVVVTRPENVTLPVVLKGFPAP